MEMSLFLSLERIVVSYGLEAAFWVILIFKFFGRQVSFRKAFLSNESINELKILKKKTLWKNLSKT